MARAVAPLSESASQAADTWVSSNWMPPVGQDRVRGNKSNQDQRSAFFARVHYLSPNMRGPEAPMPHELVPTHEESDWRWMTSWNILRASRAVPSLPSQQVL